MENLGEIENLHFQHEIVVVNHRMNGNTERMCVYSSAGGHLINLPKALLGKPPKQISLLIRKEDE